MGPRGRPRDGVAFRAGSGSQSPGSAPWPAAVRHRAPRGASPSSHLPCAVNVHEQSTQERFKHPAFTAPLSSFASELGSGGPCGLRLQGPQFAVAGETSLKLEVRTRPAQQKGLSPGRARAPEAPASLGPRPGPGQRPGAPQASAALAPRERVRFSRIALGILYGGRAKGWGDEGRAATVGRPGGARSEPLCKPPGALTG